MGALVTGVPLSANGVRWSSRTQSCSDWMTYRKITGAFWYRTYRLNCLRKVFCFCAFRMLCGWVLVVRSRANLYDQGPGPGSPSERHRPLFAINDDTWLAELRYTPFNIWVAEQCNEPISKRFRSEGASEAFFYFLMKFDDPRRCRYHDTQSMLVSML